MAVEWVEAKYGESCSAVVGKGLRLLVTPDCFRTRGGPPVPYRVEVFGATLKDRSLDRDEAKRRAERAAKSWLAEALKAFD